MTGALQLLVNRDHPKDTHSDPSRRLGPQLLENFVDIRHWAQEYFRARHKMQNVEDDVPVVRSILHLWLREIDERSVSAPDCDY